MNSRAGYQSSAGWGPGGQGAAVMMNQLRQPWASKPVLHSLSSSQERLGDPRSPWRGCSRAPRVCERRAKASPVKTIWCHPWKSKRRAPGWHQRPGVAPWPPHLLPTAQFRVPRHQIPPLVPPAILEGFPFCQSSPGSWDSLPGACALRLSVWTPSSRRPTRSDPPKIRLDFDKL